MSGLAPGTPIGPYRVLEPLGLGAMGEVYRVTDGVGRQLALKLLRGRMDGARLERFAREGEVAAGLRHSGIVQVHATGVADQGPYLVYELVEGEDLERAWRRLDRDQLLEITLHVAQALGHAHAQGVVHRDVKPANVLLDGRGRARLADFGLAQAVGLERLTQSGAVLGTPHYMAPEQAAGQRTRYGPPTDVWALGVLLYRALTGRLPFSGPDLMTLAARIASVEPPPPRQLDPTLSPGLEAVCLRALHKDPDRRYADRRVPRARPGAGAAGAPSKRKARRGRGPRVAGALGLLALLGAGAWAVVASRPARRPSS
ncbi:MAG: serine/threonine-protein kinase [Planctomycetota bacterium]